MEPGAVAEPLRLLAEDADDLAVISACLQDALTSVADTSFQPRQRRFAAVFSRFMWEGAGTGDDGGGQRVRCGLHFDSVMSVKSLGIDQQDPHGLLPLLAIRTEENGAGVDITLVFAGDGTIRLQAECLDAQLTDLSPPWPTPRRPRHDLSERDG